MVLAAAMLAGPASLEAFEPGFGGRWWTDPAVQEKAGLTPQQVGQLKGLYAAHRTRMIDLRAGLKKRQAELEGLLEAERLDGAALGRKIDEVTAARAQLDKERLSTLVGVRCLISAEQFAKLRVMQQGTRGGRRGRGPGGPCAPGLRP